MGYIPSLDHPESLAKWQKYPWIKAAALTMITAICGYANLAKAWLRMLEPQVEVYEMQCMTRMHTWLLSVAGVH